MRFQDWDVLLFPQGSSVPISEYRTGCYAVDSGVGQTPTMNTFIPSLPQGLPFHISVHSWTKPSFSAGMSILSGGIDSDNEQAVWGVRIAVDGYVVSSETFSSKIDWPQVIGDEQGRSKLTFPPFHKVIVKQKSINVADDLGRVKILISEGFNIEQGDKVRFRPISNVACFSFMHAPQELLERMNIAWPNRLIYESGESLRKIPAHSNSTAASSVVTSTTLSYPSPAHIQRVRDYRPLSDMPPPSHPSSAFASMSDFQVLRNYSLSTRSALYSDPFTSFQYAPSPLASMRSFPSYLGDLEAAYVDDDARQAVEDGVSMAEVAPPNSTEKSELEHSSFTGDDDRSTRQDSHESDTGMRLDCGQLCTCTADNPSGDCVIHSSAFGLQFPDFHRPKAIQMETKCAASPSVPDHHKRSGSFQKDVNANRAAEQQRNTRKKKKPKAGHNGVESLESDTTPSR